MARPIVNAPPASKAGLELFAVVLASPKTIALDALPKAPTAPDGLLVPAINVPALMVVTPLYIFVAASSIVPTPALMKLEAPAGLVLSSMTADTVKSTLASPVASATLKILTCVLVTVRLKPPPAEAVMNEGLEPPTVTSFSKPRGAKVALFGLVMLTVPPLSTSGPIVALPVVVLNIPPLLTTMVNCG